MVNQRTTTERTHAFYARAAGFVVLLLTVLFMSGEYHLSGIAGDSDFAAAAQSVVASERLSRSALTDVPSGGVTLRFRPWPSRCSTSAFFPRDERNQLAEDICHSLPERRSALTDAKRAKLTSRATLHAAEPTHGRPWRDVLDEIEQRAQ